MKPSRFALPVCLAVLLGACASPAWYLQATTGHLELMRSRQAVSDYIESASKDDPLAGRLGLVEDMLRFAQTDLGLDAGDSYRTIALTGRNAVVWNVVAAPEFSLQPKRYCFLVAGCVPYRGYFGEAAAHTEADRLRRKGLDVAVAPALAYSSLGWFDDPLLDTMLGLPDAALAATLFHELAHQRLYVKGDTDFNEAYASFVERRAVRAWLLARDDAVALSDWEARNQAAQDFQSRANVTRETLRNVYASGASPATMRRLKRAAFADLELAHDALAREAWGGTSWFASWFEVPPNNARLALAGSYLGGQCAFARLFRQAEGNFEAFHRLAEWQSERPAGDREAWLRSAC